MSKAQETGREPLTGASGSGDAVNLSPAVVARLESLDDIIFPAIDGDMAAVEASEPLWRETVAALGPDVVAETRSEYLRYARSTWQFLSRQTVHQPLRMLAVMKVIGLLVGDEG